MAISHTHYRILRDLKAQGVLPQSGAVLEIGQANFYFDFDPQEIAADLRAEDQESFAGLLSAPGKPLDKAFPIVEFIYRAMFDAEHVEAIDGDPAAPRSHKLDLNQPIDLGRQFETVVNHGTAEHVFDIAQVFRTMHEHCKPGGLMLHESPFTGWLDHGFYCLQPTLFWDVAASNGYQVVLMAVEVLATKSIVQVQSREQLHAMARAGNLPNNAMLFVVLRKGAEEAEFRVPMQGVYSADASEETRKAWRELR
jgi:SAM-dependent methyltransferase